MPRRLVGWFAGRARLALVPALVVALVFSFVARQDLDTVLKAKHPSGAQSYGADDVVALFDVEESREKARDAVVGWVRYGKLVESNLSRPSASARRVLGAYLLVDALVFAVAFALAIGLVFLRASPSAVADAWGGVQVNDWRRHVQRLPLLLVGLALVLDWLENLTLWRIVDGGWGSGNVDGDLVGVLHWLTVAKWLAVVFVAVPAVFLAYNALRDRIRFSDVWRVVRRLRIHVLLPIMFAAILLGHEQMPDLIRRWSVVELGWSVLAALSLALALWLGASKLLVIGRPRAITRFTHPLASYGLVGCFLLVALGLFLVDHQTQHDVGWGLLIPAALVAGLALVSAVLTLLRPPEPRGAPPERAQQVAWPVETEDGELEPPARGVERVLAAIVLGALGLAVFHASFAFAVDAREWSWATLLVGGVVCVGATVGVVAHARLDRWYTEPFLVALAFGTSVYLALRLEAAFDADPARDELDLSLLSLTGVLLGLAAIALFTMLGRYAGERARTFWVGLIMVTFFTVEIAIAVVVDPWSVAGRLGGVAVLGAFFALLAVVGFVAVWYADAVPAPPAYGRYECEASRCSRSASCGSRSPASSTPVVTTTYARAPGP